MKEAEPRLVRLDPSEFGEAIVKYCEVIQVRYSMVHQRQGFADEVVGLLLKTCGFHQKSCPAAGAPHSSHP